MDGDSNDFVNSGFNTAFCRDGQAVATGNFNLGSFRITLLGSASALTDAARADQVQQDSYAWCGVAGGTANALTLTPAPAITAYTTGGRFRFISSANANTSTTTVAISGLTTKAIQLNAAVLSANNILASRIYEIVYDGTAFQLLQAFSIQVGTGKVTLTQPATGSTLTIADGKTLTASATLTLAGTDGKTLTVSNTLALAGTDSTTMTFPPVSASIGYINVPSNPQSAAYGILAADAGYSIDHPAADTNARTYTLPANGTIPLAVGTCISFSNMTAAVITIAVTSDTMYLAGTGTTGSRSLARYGVATARKITATDWLISGTGLT